MVQGLAFLSKKGFNPTNQVNRRRVYEAEQEAKHKAARTKKRDEQLKREKDEEELARVRDGERGGRRSQLSFMYQAPPGLESNGREGEEAQSDLLQAQDGDDEAAAAFRRLLASHGDNGGDDNDDNDDNDDDDEQNGNTDQQNGLAHRFTPVLQGSTVDAMNGNGDGQSSQQRRQQQQQRRQQDTRSALEKAVGRKDKGGALSWEDQVARFPQLKNAPKAKGMSSSDVNVSFKPLGAQLRNVRCMACGVWGHSRGDRECSKTGWNPFQLSSAKLEVTPAQSRNSIVPSSKDRKKKKRKKKSSRRKHDSDSSDSSSDGEERKRRKKRHRKHKKKSAKRYGSDDSQEGDGDDWDQDSVDEQRRKRKRNKHSRKHRRSRSERNGDDDEDDNDISQKKQRKEDQKEKSDG
uniref:CBF1-interacting co-repressor CIR N-terminal domain-containing protein n=1 Tax=Craspedostauros australis TaxID=1486917 RepID=A0A7R9WQS9_9STRA|mmetsp:Transcript_13983/g.38420  ORF Transcript_13983/g.38420 Transcript_13983/m.38420 type:complete len:406 (+) Transcript_13983:84-1301(+)|eukprot:CAMPEP_0198136320 /NCGR_PEP_ID=MMETSP1442-20131203/61051_1 /TAXON_ID= /ORGANISM="Craspedostauros australis, Strain CCMP3328" /LENGTH=405 /DNA_ID=CAMNT_0043797533 /DNA_START=53 /DNA_END=1270 /DNA_ORIENTATION=+